MKNTALLTATTVEGFKANMKSNKAFDEYAAKLFELLGSEFKAIPSQVSATGHKVNRNRIELFSNCAIAWINSARYTFEF